MKSIVRIGREAWASSKETIAEANPEALLADGFEEALIGHVERFGMAPVALYDRTRCIEILMKRDGMTEDEAEEFFCFNTIGAWAGDGTPAFATLFPPALPAKKA